MKTLAYLAMPPFGGWSTFTAHLVRVTGAPLVKVRKRLENYSRPFGYGVSYQNIPPEALAQIEGLLVTAIDKDHYYLLPFLRDSSIVIHDPTELTATLRGALHRFRVITIRESVQAHLRTEYGIDSIFMSHPFFAYPRTEDKPKQGVVSISRIDYDKHIEILLQANTLLGSQGIRIMGTVNRMYVHQKLKGMDLKRAYMGVFPKSFEALDKRLARAKFVADMSAIKHDGGGTQYTFLEAIYHGCALILSERWVHGWDSPFKHGETCYIVRDAYELAELIRSDPDTTAVTTAAYSIMQRHIEAAEDWRRIVG